MQLLIQDIRGMVCPNVLQGKSKQWEVQLKDICKLLKEIFPVIS